MNLCFRIALSALAFAVTAAGTAMAQNPTAEARARQIRPASPSPLIDADEPFVISEAESLEASAGEELRPVKSLPVLTSYLAKYQPLLAGAIDQRLGAPYHWGSIGPRVFDCSGFVWAAFRAAGVDFERGSARTLWGRFTAPAAGEQYKFGTLVFFSHLHHVGIVADEHGFYHASRHHGVVYAPFNDYWLSRIDGFRRVPLPVQQQRTD